MSINNEYKNIYNKEIIQKNKGIIISYPVTDEKYRYVPYSHGISEEAVEKLADLMRKNLFFYAFGEEEIVDYYKKDFFNSMEQGAQYAYQKRSPKRADTTDGLLGEVLIDLLIQMYNPKAYKLSVRTIFRQDDNTEIKGYDSTYFSKDEHGISLWLGQAKLGGKDYCKSGINEDLVEKYLNNYLTTQLFFVCDKRIAITDDAKCILEMIEKINIKTMNADADKRASELIKLFNDNEISIKIPCLLAYDKSDVYYSEQTLTENIMNEVNSIKGYFDAQIYKFNGFKPEIVFYIFPIEDVSRLRNKETGFYAGLC